MFISFTAAWDRCRRGVAVSPAVAELDVTKLNSKVDVPIRDKAGKPVILPGGRAASDRFYFVSTARCRILTSDPLTDLAKEYAPKGVTVIGLCPTDASAAEIRKTGNQVSHRVFGLPR